MAGLLEGEGFFFMRTRRRYLSDKIILYSYPKVGFHSTDRDVVEHVAELWGGPALESHPRRQAHWKDQWGVAKVGRPAEEIMRRILPYMGERRSAKIRDLIETARPDPVVEWVSAQE